MRWYREGYLSCTKLRIPGKNAIVHQFHRGIFIHLLRIDNLKHRLQPILRKDKPVDIPLVHRARVDISLEAGHNAKVMSCSAHRPPEVWVRAVGHSHCRTIGQNDVHRNQHVDDKSVEALVPAVASAECWADDSYARAAAGAYVHTVRWGIL